MSQITLAEQSTPATPSSGTSAIYPKSDGRFYGIDDAGQETALGGIVSAASFATTSGVNIDTAIPASVKRLILNLSGVSVSGTTGVIFRLGDSGGVVTTGYAGSAVQVAGGFTPAGTTSTGGFVTQSGAAGNIYHGQLMFSLEDSANNTWVLSGFMSHSNQAAMDVLGGSVSLTGELTTLRMGTVDGVSTFDAGKANIQYFI